MSPTHCAKSSASSPGNGATSAMATTTRPGAGSRSRQTIVAPCIHKERGRFDRNAEQGVRRETKASKRLNKPRHQWRVVEGLELRSPASGPRGARAVRHPRLQCSTRSRVRR